MPSPGRRWLPSGFLPFPLSGLRRVSLFSGLVHLARTILLPTLARASPGPLTHSHCGARLSSPCSIGLSVCTRGDPGFIVAIPSGPSSVGAYPSPEASFHSRCSSASSPSPYIRVPRTRRILLLSRNMLWIAPSVPLWQYFALIFRRCLACIRFTLCLRLGEVTSL